MCLKSCTKTDVPNCGVGYVHENYFGMVAMYIMLTVTGEYSWKEHCISKLEDETDHYEAIFSKILI